MLSIEKTVSAIMLTLLLTSFWTLVFNIQPVRASGTIYIRADGLIDPPTAPVSTLDNATYMLTGDITSSSDGIIVERDNVIIDGHQHTVQGPGTSNGISMMGRSNITVKNTIISNFYSGIYLSQTNKTTLSGNDITSNSGDGISLDFSSNNSMVANNISVNNQNGIDFYVSPNNSVGENNITNNNDGIDLTYSSSNNGISGNNIADNWVGVDVYYSSNNSISVNGISANHLFGVCLDSSSNDSIIGNNITNNDYGIYVEWSSSDNKFYHNSFINNNVQADVIHLHPNVWDNGYPSGGNYWSDYNGTDLYSGPHQNETGSDGIGDTPYVIDSNNQDNYPLTRPYIPFDNQTIYINADGSFDPSGAPIQRKGDLYTLMDNILSNADGIVIEKDNIVLEGADYTVQGTGASYSRGISLSGRGNVTIKNTNVKKFYHGIYLLSSIDCKVENVTATDNAIGIGLPWDSNQNILSHNNATNNSEGIYLQNSNSNNITSNTITDGGWGIDLQYDSSNNTLSGNVVSSSMYGIQLWGSGPGNNLSGNIVSSNLEGIVLNSANNNTLSGNVVSSNGRYGITLMGDNNIIFGNTVVNNSASGIYINSHYNNTISSNKIEDNEQGIFLTSSNENKLFHNNFINNTSQVHSVTSTNVWDNGCEGNYWSDCNGTDSNNDGVGETPYTIDANNTDRYPLMNVYWSPCDINHDLKVNMKDVGRSARAFGTVPGDALWNPHADITGPEFLVPDSKVDMRDIGLTARHFGDHYP